MEGTCDRRRNVRRAGSGCCLGGIERFGRSRVHHKARTGCHIDYRFGFKVRYMKVESGKWKVVSGTTIILRSDPFEPLDPFYGRLAQLGERLVRNEEVASS